MGADVVFETDGVCFLTFDDEHHRLAIIDDQSRLPAAIIDAVGDHDRPDLRHRAPSTVVAAAEDLIAPKCTGRDSDRLDIDAEDPRRIREEVDLYAQEMRAVLRG